MRGLRKAKRVRFRNCPSPPSSSGSGFEDGGIDQEKRRTVFASHAPQPRAGERMWVGIEQPESPTCKDRTVVYKPNLPQSSKPITYGWQFSTLVVLPEEPSSWTSILDQMRIGSTQTAVQVA